MAIIEFPEKYRMGKLKRRFNKGNKARYRLSQAGGGPSTAFSPSDIAGLALWLKADAIVGLNDGDPVVTWEDSSSANNDATQGTAANRPVYKTSIVNGLPVVRLDATNDGMVTANNAFTAKPFSFFLVYAGNSNGGARRTLQSGSGQNWTIAPFGNTWRYFNGTDNIIDGFVAGAFRVHTIIQTASLASYWIAGSSVGTAASAGVNPGIITLGASGTFAEPMDGDIAEIIGYTADLTGQRTTVEAYLASKYGL